MQPTPPQWLAISEALDELIELPAAMRLPRLRALGGDPIVLNQVESLLASSDASAGFLQGAVESVHHVPADYASLTPGARVGPFRIERLLGRGGMGEVYLGERADAAFAQRVALKLLRPEAIRGVERFQEERRILAALEHPNIARLIDGGLAQDGRPYMAMEYVEGLTLPCYCADRGLDLRERLELFRQLCGAVDYAHRNLVVHRDLKPGNVLVTADGQAKLLDFGIARLLEANADERTLTGAMLTPEYAAPEQLAGQRATTATDIYALGLLLFELLAGEKPWSSSGGALPTALKRLLDEEPPPPSRVAMQVRLPPVAPKLLRGDLDAIVLKALRRKPEARYESVAALVADLTRHERLQAVLAREGARAYRLRRYVRRNWIALSGACAVVVALIVGAGGVAWQAMQTREEAARAAAAGAFLISVFKASDARVAQDKPRGQITARELLDAGSARIEAEFENDPEIQLRLLDTLAAAYYHLHEKSRARALRLELRQRAVALYGEDHPKALRLLEAEVWDALNDENLELAQALLAERDGQIRRGGLDRSVHRAAWWLMRDDALERTGGNVASRRKALMSALGLYREFAQEDSGHPVALLNLCRLELRTGDPHRALAWCDEALTVHTRIDSKDGRDVARIHHARALAFEKLGDLPAARDAMNLSLHRFERTLGLQHLTDEVRDARRLGITVETASTEPSRQPAHEGQP